MRLFFLAAAAAFSVLQASAARAPQPSPTPPVPVAPRESIDANDNRVPAGSMSHGVLHLALDARWGMWYPDTPAHPGAPMQAFAANGGPLQDPGPLIRVPLGTEVVVRIRDSIPGSQLTVHGLVDRPGDVDRPETIAFGTERTIRFRAGAAGTYDYWATTSGAHSIDVRTRWDSRLSGAIVVDPPGTDERDPGDRIFVIGTWLNVYGPDGSPVFRYDLHTINGRAWPYTERLTYARGSVVRWRVIDAGDGSHPMHLHGFYFQVLSRGDGIGEVDYDPARRYAEVTELVHPGGTFEMTWTAARPGNWLFHCHIPGHTVAHAPIADMLTGKPVLAAAAFANGYVPHAEMGGLVLGVTVTGPPPAVDVAGSAPVRRLTLVAAPAPDDAPDLPSFSFALHDGAAALTEPGRMGPPIVLTQGEPVDIDVVNRLHEETSIHWHGMELGDSYFDGAAGFSGEGARIAPEIEPGASFDASFTPPRAGTFIYHSHTHDQWQMRGGLAGALIVLPRGAQYDPSTDHVVMVSSSNRIEELAKKAFINGEAAPDPLVVHAGTPQRLRLINISATFFLSVVSLESSSGPLRWTPLAVDGADLPPALRVPQPAVHGLTIGQTLDFAFTPAAPGDLTLVVRIFSGGPVIGRLPIRVI